MNASLTRSKESKAKAKPETTQCRSPQKNTSISMQCKIPNSKQCKSNQQPQAHILHHPPTNALNPSQLAQSRHALALGFLAHVQIA